MSSFDDILSYAKLDTDRSRRHGGCGETVFCEGKTDTHLLGIFKRFVELGGNTLGTRCTPEQAESLCSSIPELEYNVVSRLVKFIPTPPASLGCVCVCCAGTSDIPVAEEAAGTAEFFGSRVTRVYDVGVAGLHRLLASLDELRSANVIIAAAGMEGALPSVVAGLVSVPVIALPTSVGYGASFGGVAALLAMLNSCAEGVSVVNIDNGFGAGYLANRINLQTIGERAG